MGQAKFYMAILCVGALICQASGVSSQEAPTEPPLSIAGENAALIYIFRESNMRLSGGRDLYMDETPITTLPRLSYTYTIAEPGWHLMWGDTRTEWFEFLAGHTYLLRIVPNGVAGSSDSWALDDPGRIRQAISEFNLEYVVSTEEDLTDLRGNVDRRYERTRRRAGDAPESIFPIELDGVQYRDEPPGLFRLISPGGGGRGTTLTVTETMLSYESRDEELEILIDSIQTANLMGPQFDWIAIVYTAQGSSKAAYFSLGGRGNRTMLAIQNSILVEIGIETPEN